MNMDIEIPDWGGGGSPDVFASRFISSDRIMTNDGSYETRAWAWDVRKAPSRFYQRILTLELDKVEKHGILGTILGLSETTFSTVSSSRAKMRW